MEQSQSIAELAKAVIAVMKEVKGIDKSMTVGEGRNAYKGVSDKDVKNAIGKAMEKNGLCIIPIGIENNTKIERWEEVDTYSKIPGAMKTKQSVFTEVTTKYLLLHESGQSIELAGYGHGIDSQDKGAGKATTYALKYALLYTFMVPTGKIDDADATHSEEMEAPKPKGQLSKPSFAPGHLRWDGAVKALAEGKINIEQLEKSYSISPENRELLLTTSI